MALRKYSSVHCNFLERTLINIASRKIWLSCFQRKNYNQYLVSSSLCCCFRCQSVVHCSIQGNFHLVIKAVFLFFFFFFCLSFVFFVILLALYPSNTTQTSLTYLPYPGDSYPPTWHAYSTNADDALYVQHFLSQWHSSTKHCLGAAAGSLPLSYAAIIQFDYMLMISY